MSTFSILAFQARVSPDSVDRNQLLTEASDLLERLPERPSLARDMAVEALEFAIYGEPCYMGFRAAFDAFMADART